MSSTELPRIQALRGNSIVVDPVKAGRKSACFADMTVYSGF